MQPAVTMSEKNESLAVIIKCKCVNPPLPPLACLLARPTHLPSSGDRAHGHSHACPLSRTAHAQHPPDGHAHCPRASHFLSLSLSRSRIQRPLVLPFLTPSLTSRVVSCRVVSISTASLRASSYTSPTIFHTVVRPVPLPILRLARLVTWEVPVAMKRHGGVTRAVIFHHEC